MRNDIAFFEKSTSSMVPICEKIDVEFIFALDFAQIFQIAKRFDSLNAQMPPAYDH